jgi:glutamine amidotransferase
MEKAEIAIVDYGMGNLRSVQKALERVDCVARIIERPEDVGDAGGLVVPGVGAFADAMARLREHDWELAIAKWIKADKPFLGICLGLQVLFERSYEDGLYEGFGFVKGEVVRFDFSLMGDKGKGLKIPHMGWNRLRWSKPCPLLEGIPQGGYFYFVHSYHVVPASDAGVSVVQTDYGYPFVSMIWRGNMFGCQFHPEKSQLVGSHMLRNFAKMVKNL